MVCVALADIVFPFKSVTRTFTVTGTSTNELDSMVQVRVTFAPIGRMGLFGSLIRVTTGGGTAKATMHAYTILQ